MGKTESTAVNELIDLVQNRKPIPLSEPGADLFSAPPASHPARMTSTIPPMRGAAGDVPPLPRSRAPQATREQPRPTLPMPHSMRAPLASSPGIPRPLGSSAAISPPLPRATTSSPAITPPLPRATTSSPAITPPPPPAAMRASSPSILTPPAPSVRMSTAPAPRGSTIPPLAKRAAAAGTVPPPLAPSVQFDIDLDLEPTTQAQIPTPAAAPQLARTSLPELPSKPELLFEARADATWVGTPTRESSRRSLAKMLALPAIACVAAGIGLGLYLTANKSKAKPTTAAAKPTPSTAAPTPAAPPSETVLHPKAPSIESSNAGTSTAGGDQPQPPTKEEQAAQMAAAAAGDAAALTHDAPAEAVAGIQEVQTPKGVVKLADIRIDTSPSGAAITLVDRGKQFPLGSTPLSTSLDTSRQYDVIIEMAGRPSQMVHLDPSTTTRLYTSLARKQAAAVAPSVPAEKKAPVAKIEDDLEKPAAASAPKKAEKAEKAAKVETPEKAEKPAKAEKAEKSGLAEPFESTDAAPAADGPGVLMISSKPPCEILVDGKATGLTTPQRAMELPAGRHKITFSNTDLGIKETFTVVVKPGEPTKLIKDFLDRK